MKEKKEVKENKKLKIFDIEGERKNKIFDLRSAEKKKKRKGRTTDLNTFPNAFLVSNLNNKQ